MNKAVGVATFLVKKIWFFLAVALVLFALLLSAARYALPHLETKKQYIESYIEEQYGVALSIDNIHAVWLKTGPSIVLNDVAIDSLDTSPVALTIDQVYVEIDFWRSLSQAMVKSRRFDLKGLRVDINATQLEQQQGSGEYPIVDALESLFLNQLQRFSLSDSEVAIHKADGVSVLELESLQWSNRGERHQGLGQIRAQELANNSASFILDLHGEGESTRGTFYARGQELDVSPWISGLLETPMPLIESRANAELWVSIENGTVSNVQALLGDSRLQWGDDTAESLQTHVRRGEFTALPVDGDWLFRVDDLVVETNNRSLVTDFVGAYTQGNEFVINTIKPMEIAPFAAFMPLFSETLTPSDVDALRPSGELAIFQLQSRPQGVSLAAKVIDVGWQQTNLTPGLDGVDLDLYWYKNQGSIILSANDAKLDIDHLLPADLNTVNVAANAFVYQEKGVEGQWVIQIPALSFSSEQLSFQSSARYETGTALLSIATQIEGFDTKNVKSLLPEPLMGKHTTAFLNRAFNGAGRVSSANMIWQGQPSEFPFTDNQGIFHAQVHIDDAEFVFSSQWPQLSQLELQLDFINNDLFMKSPSAKLEGVDVSKMSAHIMQLSNAQEVVIDAYGQTTGRALTNLMLQSSLSRTLGDVLDKGVLIDGNIASTLNLQIPLTDNDVVAKGTASLLGSRVTVPAIDMVFDNAQGSVSFVNETISASGLSASLLSQAVVLDLFSEQQGSEYVLNAKLNGDWLIEPLVNRFNPEYLSYINGSAQWSADVDVSFIGKDVDYSAQITSSLTGLSSSLPAPFNKLADDEMALRLTSEGNRQASTIMARLGSDVRFDGILPHQERQFSRAHLALGDSELVGLGTGFSISANVDNLFVEDWYKAIELLVGGLGESQQTPIFSVPERIFIDAEHLVLFEQTLDDVSITAKQLNKNWLLDIASDQARASVNLYDQWLSRGIEIEADFIQLNDWKQADRSFEHDWDHAKLPPIYFHCSQCTLFNRDLGEVTVDVAKSDLGMTIRRLEAKSNDGHLSAAGTWAIENGDSLTNIKGRVDSPDIGRLLENYGINSGIKDSEAELTFELSWPDSPMDFAFESVDGEAKWSLTDGYLSELSDQGSRIFTLFSLNSLVRKLSLDFRDVFAKGFFYDGMKGTIQIHDGLAVTDDTEIDGGAGEIEIVGYTNLIDQTLDYNVSFAPNVTGNLPILVYFAVNPPTALAALAIDQMLTSAKVISNVNYRVTGPISEPSIEEVGRDSKDIELPARVAPESEPEIPVTDEDLTPLKVEIIDG